MDFVLILLGAVFFWFYGAYFGWKARENYAKKLTAKLLENIKGQEQEENSTLIQIKIEQHAGMFYVYDKQDNSFMAQGSTKEELENALSYRYPGKRFAAAEEELEKAGFIS